MKYLITFQDTGTDMIDFHNHTALCGHAEGAPELYIEKAISRGIKHYGFSDHAPLPEDMREGITMMPEQVEGYICLIEDLKKRYSDRIEILLGFEVDFPLRDTFDKKYFSDSRIDYLIGSCHYLEKWPVDNSKFLEGYETRGVNNVYRNYYTNVLDLVKSGKFNILGHMDLPKKYGFHPDEDFTELITKIAAAAKETDTAIEINTAGLRKPVKEMYPSREILEILIFKGTPITLGSDSHSPNEAGKDIDTAISLLKELGCSEISHFRKRKRYTISI